MAAQFITPLRKSRTSKNDRNDAEAIATAARQGNMRFVPVKAVDQQAMLAHDLDCDPHACVKRPMAKPRSANTPRRQPPWCEKVPRQRAAVATGQTHPERT